MNKTKEELEKDGLIVAQGLCYSGNPTDLNSINVGHAYCSGYCNGYNSRDEEVAELVKALKDIELRSRCLDDGIKRNSAGDKQISAIWSIAHDLLNKNNLL